MGLKGNVRKQESTGYSGVLFLIGSDQFIEKVDLIVICAFVETRIAWEREGVEWN